MDILYIHKYTGIVPAHFEHCSSHKIDSLNLLHRARKLVFQEIEDYEMFATFTARTKHKQK